MSSKYVKIYSELKLVYSLKLNYYFPSTAVSSHTRIILETLTHRNAKNGEKMVHCRIQEKEKSIDISTDRAKDMYIDVLDRAGIFIFYPTGSLN